MTPKREAQKDRGWQVNGSGQTDEKAVRGKASSWRQCDRADRADRVKRERERESVRHRR